MALELALAQIEGQMCDPRFARGGRLGFMYITPEFGPEAEQMLDVLRKRTRIPDWVGSVGTAVFANGIEYVGEPAVTLMIGDFPEDAVQVFSGRQRPPMLDARTERGFRASYTALVHVDPQTPDVAEMIGEMSERTHSGQLFGGMSSSSTDTFQIANHVIGGGLSGAVFSSEVRTLTRMTKACHALGEPHKITRVDGQYIREIDGQPALDVLFDDLGLGDTLKDITDPQKIVDSLPLDRISAGLYVGLLDREKPVREDFVVRNLVGIDPKQRVVAAAADMQAGDQLRFCTRDAQRAKADLVRMLTRLRDEIEQDPTMPMRRAKDPLPVRGAIYVSCTARGKALFGDPSVELQLIHQHLGDIPLVGFAASGEIAGSKMFGYTGVLTLFL